MNTIKKDMVAWVEPKRSAGAINPNTGQGTPSLMSMVLQGLLVLAGIGGILGSFYGVQLALRSVVGLLGVYAIMSANEYVVHRYYQHLGINKNPIYRFLRVRFGFPLVKSSGHVEHHRETLDDMTLDRRPDANLDSDPFRGTAFSWNVSAMMTGQIAF